MPLSISSFTPYFLQPPLSYQPIHKEAPPDYSNLSPGYTDPSFSPYQDQNLLAPQSVAININNDVVYRDSSEYNGKSDDMIDINGELHDPKAWLLSSLLMSSVVNIAILLTLSILMHIHYRHYIAIFVSMHLQPFLIAIWGIFAVTAQRNTATTSLASRILSRKKWGALHHIMYAIFGVVNIIIGITLAVRYDRYSWYDDHPGFAIALIIIGVFSLVSLGMTMHGRGLFLSCIIWQVLFGTILLICSIVLVLLLILSIWFDIGILNCVWFDCVRCFCLETVFDWEGLTRDRTLTRKLKSATGSFQPPQNPKDENGETNHPKNEQYNEAATLGAL